MPSPDQQICDLYADQLRILKYGHALYEPEPNEGEGEVQIGDVGYIDSGRFVRFASVFSSEHGIPGVEEKYRTVLKLGKLDDGVMSSRKVHHKKVEFGVSANEPISGASVGACITFSCESDRGASLITRHQSKNEKAKFHNVLEDHFIGHILSYKEIADVERLPIKNLHDIILVTRRVMTGDWATIAFHSRTEESSASFDIKAATVTASGRVWGKWSEHASYPKRHGPTRQVPFSDDEEPPENALDQCIFITPFRISDIGWFKKVKLALMLKSGGPSGIHAHDAAVLKNAVGANASASNPYDAPQVSIQETIDSTAESIEVDENLTAYEVLAFHAFQTVIASGFNYDFICIDEEDIQHFQPKTCLLEDLQDVVLELSVLNFSDASLTNSSANVGRLQQTPSELKNRDAVAADTSIQPQHHGDPVSLSSFGNDKKTRSRNSLAQARHRAQRKAYIEQLEDTVVKLQTMLAISPEQVASMPPLSQRVRELEEENKKLLAENDRLRQVIETSSETVNSDGINERRNPHPRNSDVPHPLTFSYITPPVSLPMSPPPTEVDIDDSQVCGVDDTKRDVVTQIEPELNLPIELILLIGGFAARSSRRAAISLSLVSRKMREATLPTLYRTVILHADSPSNMRSPFQDHDHQGQQSLSTAKSEGKSLADPLVYVRHLWADVPQELALRNLDAFPNLQQLAIHVDASEAVCNALRWGPSKDCCPGRTTHICKFANFAPCPSLTVLSQSHLQRWTAFTSTTQGRAFLAQITHLRLLNVCHSHCIPLEYIPSLTHLCIPFFDLDPAPGTEFVGLENILAQPHLKMVVLTLNPWYWRFEDMNLKAWACLAMARDERLYVIVSTCVDATRDRDDPRRDWKAEATGGVSIWEKAIQVRRKLFTRLSRSYRRDHD